MSKTSLQQHVPLMNKRLDELAQTSSDTPWAFIPINNARISDGYQAVTFGQLARSVYKLAHWIEKTVGVGKDRETIAYMDRSNDIRYIFAILAANRTGHKVLLTSTRNSVEGQRHLIKSTNCVKFLHGAESKADVESLRNDQTNFESIQIPTLEELLNGETELYNDISTGDPYETSIIIHTSGSTGLPKPINLRNGYIATVANLPQKTGADGRLTMASVVFGQSKTLCTLPLFHAMGLFTVIRSILNQGPLVLPPPGVSNTAELNMEVIKYGKPEVAFLPPSILEDISEQPEGLDILKKLDFVVYAGAPLAQAVGDKVCKVVKLQTMIGSTEAGIIDTFINEDQADWMYFDWCPWTGSQMEPVDDLHELVLKRADIAYQGAFYSFPEINEWNTKDLYERHPTRSGLWKYRGRKDDVIVLSNGEKFNPIILEKFVDGHPRVKGALVVGDGHFQAGLLVEVDGEIDPETFLEELWPTIEKGNSLVAAHGRVWKSKVAFAKPSKRFARAPKGNQIRRQINEDFKDEIEALYSNEGFADQLPQLESNADHAAVKEFIKQAIHLTAPSVPQDVDETADIFAYGVDSLQVLGLSSAISHAIPKAAGVHDTAVKARTIYGNPSIEQLTQAITDLIHNQGGDRPTVSREQHILQTIQKYTANLPTAVEYYPRQQKHAVILTGSTGSLGNYVLEYLLAAPDVAKIYCLNRSDAEARQKKSFEERGVVPDFTKVTFLQTSFDKEHFGLSLEVYKELQSTVDIFIHNAWAVNFNMGLESFEDTHIAGTRRVVDFSAGSHYRPNIIFISSIASTGNWAGSGHEGPVPEVFFEDDRLPLPQGYGESKHVAGRILAQAAKECGVPSSLIRLGQVGGPKGEKGLWNKQEWLPSIIASSKAIGKIPRTLGSQDVVDWIPVDSAAHTVIDIARTRLHTQGEKKLDVFHLVNPHHVSWTKLYPAVQEYYAPSGINLEVVEFSEWLSILKSLPMTPEQATKVPGMKLIDFYEGLNQDKGGLPLMATDHTVESSETLKELGPVSRDLITNWLKQWAF